MIRFDIPEKIEAKKLRQLKSRTTISNLSELKLISDPEHYRLKHIQAKSCELSSKKSSEECSLIKTDKE